MVLPVRKKKGASSLVTLGRTFLEAVSLGKKLLGGENPCNAGALCSTSS